MREPTRSAAWLGDASRTRDDGPEAADEPVPASVGRFLIRGVLGRGGMATVYRAYDPERGREVALKVLRGAADARRAARFRREIALGRRLRLEQLVGPLDEGEDALGPFFSMELVEAPTLAQLLERDGPFAPRRAAGLVADLARVVAALHVAQVVHRDLKPANVLVDPARGPLLLDLGLARDLRRRRPLTRRHELVGTVSYMAPEQVTGRADELTDVWALGAVLYALLTGRPPFRGPALRVLSELVRSDPIAPGLLVPGLSPDLEALLLRTLDRDPARRPQGALALADALDDQGTRRWMRSA